jgi:phosphoribosylglycinamide formyltransferase-1
VRVAVLVSGQGSNLQALIDRVHEREAQIVAVASDRPGAPALARAEAAGIATAAFPLAQHPDRVARDLALADWLAERGAELIVLAGYMALLTSAFLARFPDRVVNVHPSLLPAFPGVRAIEQALEHGAKVTGVTVHLVDEGVDTGAILLQRAIPMPETRDPAAVHAALQPLEHELLPEAVRLFAAGRVSRDPADPARILLAPGPGA